MITWDDSMDNLQIYNELKTVPTEAQREIKAGRLKGKTDINPMWRIKVLTEKFGPCGIGWKPEIVKMWLENGADGEISAFVEINLYIRVNGEWSEPIPGVGGSAFVANETKGKYTSDECYKMAFTDAISVSCKLLGIAGDVYWDKDPTKYTNTKDNVNPTCIACGKEIKGQKDNNGKFFTGQQIADQFGGKCIACSRIKGE